ncbi:MAG: MFS transporter [Candidatus Hermodarchaeota archaeon]
MSEVSYKDFWITTFLPFSAAMAAAGTLIPLFILTLGDVSDIGTLSALTSFVSLPLTFIWGKLTDDSGKRKIFILIGFISGFGILFGYFLANSFLWLIILSVLSGLLLGAGDTAKKMYIYDTYPIDLWEEKISKFHKLTGLGSCAGLFFGGIFQMFFQNYELFFLICAIFCGLSAFLAYLIIREIPTDKTKYKIEKLPILNLDLPVFSSIYQPRKSIPYTGEKTEKGVEKHSKSLIILFLLAGFMFFLSSTLTFTPLPAFITSSGPTGLSIDPAWVFWIFLAYYGISVVGYIFAGNWIDKMGNRKILFVGLIVRTGVYAFFVVFAYLVTQGIVTLVGSTLVVVILLMFSGMSFSLMNVALQNTIPHLIQENLGELLALYSIVIGVSSIIGSFSSGFIAETYGYPWLFLLSVIFGIIAFLIYFISVKERG